MTPSIAVDWEQFGFAPVGFDLAYLVLAVNAPFEQLLAAYADDTDSEPVRRGAVLVAAYTAISRAAWAVARPSPGAHLARLLELSDLVREAAG